MSEIFKNPRHDILCLAEVGSIGRVGPDLMAEGFQLADSVLIDGYVRESDVGALLGE